MKRTLIVLASLCGLMLLASEPAGAQVSSTSSTSSSSTTSTSTTTSPRPVPAISSTASTTPAVDCNAKYTGACLPVDESVDVDCAGGSGNGPLYVEEKNFHVVTIGVDPFQLDADKDGIACESTADLGAGGDTTTTAAGGAIQGPALPRTGAGHTAGLMNLAGFLAVLGVLLTLIGARQRQR